MSNSQVYFAQSYHSACESVKWTELVSTAQQFVYKYILESVMCLSSEVK